MASLEKSSTVTQKDSHTYTIDFDPAWTIGSVPHGGYVTAVFLRVVSLHFSTTLAAQNQPHTLTLHLDFLRRTQVGPAIFRVKDVKLGRQTAVVHVTLFQEGREEVVGYITNSNIATEQGVSFETSWTLKPTPLLADTSKFESDTDPNWGERKHWPFADFRKATKNVRSWFPRAGQPEPGVIDEWLCLRNGENWTNESLGSVVDTFPQVIETLALDEDPYSVDKERRDDGKSSSKDSAGFWYPTVLLNLDVKKALPKEGVRWLYVRLQAKKIKNGRFDLEIVVLDAEGDLVALSHHVCFAVSAARNLAARRKGDKGESKL
ncbi:hypothetical protein Q7P37_002833 [Cladosporium fusiforme]